MFDEKYRATSIKQDGYSGEAAGAAFKEAFGG